MKQTTDLTQASQPLPPDESSRQDANPELHSGMDSERLPDVSLKLASLLNDTPEHTPNETLAIHLSSGHDFHGSKPDDLLEAENARREKDLTKLLHRLSQVDTFHPKTKEKAIIHANRLIGKAPGVRALPVADQRAVTHAVLAAASKTGLKGLQHVIQHTISQRRKHKALKSHVTAMFEGGMVDADEPSTKDIEHVKKYIDSDGLHSQIQAHDQYAEGGSVHKPLMHDHVAMHYPEHAMLSSAAKTRAHAYLNSLKPQPKHGLPFDMNKDQGQEDKQYHKAIHMAVKPMSILNQIKSGSVSPSDFKHFTALHPELYDLLKKEMTTKITEMQLAGKKPDSKTRQGLSLFMGVPLESNLNPAAIQAIQAVFQPKQPPQQAQGQENPNKVKKGTAPLSKLSQNYRTAEEASEARASK